LSTIKRVSFADHPQAVFMALASRGCAAVYALPLDGLNKMKNPVRAAI
jgi:hypothetical protein